MLNLKRNVINLFLLGLFIKECYSCFTMNETYSQAMVKAGDSFYLECGCLESKYDAENLKWLDPDDKEIEPMGPGTKPKMYTEKHGRELWLLIPIMSKSISGSYKCATTVDGHQFAITHPVVAYESMYFFNMSETQYIVNGRDSHINCQVRSDTPPRFKWYKGEDESIEIVKSAKYDMNAKGITVKNVTTEDGGIYKCTATEERSGEQADRFIKVEVLRAPHISTLKAKPEQVVLVGESLTIECQAEGYPLPDYFWNKTSNAGVSSDTNITWHQAVNEIIFPNVSADDRGTYECLARNAAGEVRKTITVEVLTPPTISYFPNKTVAEGAETKIVCKASGRPRPKIGMTFESEKSSADESLTYDVIDSNDTDTEFSLIFKKVQRSHEGLFYCNATNDVGYVVEGMYIRVLYKPYFTNDVETIWAWKDKAVNLSCEHDSYPPAEIKWSYHGSNETISADDIEVRKFLLEEIDESSAYNFPINFTRNTYYGTYVCTAKNNFGEAKKTIHVREGFRPSDIENVTIVDKTATSTTFIFESPKFIGPNVTGFTAEYDEAENYNITNIHLNRTWAADRPIRLTKLKPSTKYLIKFAALNEIGIGPFTEMYEFETPEKSIPEPLDLDKEFIEIPSDSEPKLQLKIPDDNGDPIDYFTIKYCPMSQGELVQQSCIEHQVPVASEISLNHLDFNTTYHVEFVAHNGEGNSTPTIVYLHMPESLKSEQKLLSGGAIIAISVIVVVLCIVLLDLLLYFTRKQGMIASCCHKKTKKRKEDTLQSRDKKGLLKDNGESAPDDVKRNDNGHKEFEYNKSTGVITGKHSAV